MAAEARVLGPRERIQDVGPSTYPPEEQKGRGCPIGIQKPPGAPVAPASIWVVNRIGEHPEGRPCPWHSGEEHLRLHVDGGGVAAVVNEVRLAVGVDPSAGPHRPGGGNSLWGG